MQNQKIFGSEGGFTNCTNAWIEGGGLSDILKESAARGDREGFFYNCYLRINGVEDKLTYANELYKFYLELKNRKRQIVVVNGRRGRVDGACRNIEDIASGSGYSIERQEGGGIRTNFEETGYYFTAYT